MQCVDEIKEYIDCNRSLTEQELNSLLSRFFDMQHKRLTNLLTSEEIEFIQNVYSDSSFD